MKSGKEITRVAKKLFEASLVDGKLDTAAVKKIVAKLAYEKPRGYLSLIKRYVRLVRLEVESKRVVIQSATELEPSVKSEVIADLSKKYGDQIEAEYVIDPDLLGGMRIRVGSDVWDGSVKNRLERLSSKFN